MANILVNPEHLHSLGIQLNTGAGSIETILSRLTGQVAPLQSEGRGVAQARFEQLWTESHRSSRQSQEALHGVFLLTQSAASSCHDAESAIATSFGG